MTKSRQTTRAQYCGAALGGVTLAAAAFAQQWYLQLASLFALVPIFWIIRTVPPKHAYTVGLAFAAAWLLPTTYWYYRFMPAWLAFVASFGFATLLASVFNVVWLRKRIGGSGACAIFIALWCGLTALRLHLSLTAGWWLPYLGYSIWHNTALLQIGRFGGEPAIELVILGVNAGLAYVLIKWGRVVFAGVSAGVFLVVIGCNILFWQLPAKPVSPVVAVQAMPQRGADQPATAQDVSHLLQWSAVALRRLNSRQVVTVVLPENSIPAANQATLADFARTQRVRVVYHTTELTRRGIYKKVVILGTDGRVILANYKEHIAPGENGSPKKSAAQVLSGGQVLTAYICYDLHYADVVRRLAGSDVAYVPVNDADYGYLQHQFHAADISLRAVQARTSIITASTNGPTMVVNSNGVILRQLRTSGTAVLVYPGA